VRERRFSDDLAHELRTPIAELRTISEVGGRWPEDGEAVRQFFHDTEAIAGQLESTVATLLLLARCEEGGLAVESRAVLLEKLVAESWRQVLAGTAGTAGTAIAGLLENRLAPDLAVATDPAQLGMILRNLLDNALTHGVPGQPIRCSSEAMAEGVWVRLENTVADLQPEDLAHLAERFWRKEASRMDRRHVGLGLSIVQAMSRALGVRVEMELTGGTCLVVSLFFPTLKKTEDKSAALSPA
jgi:signal transduction histidine kinase